MNLFYLIGEPGIGKTTLFEELTRGLDAVLYDQPFAHRHYACGVVELGRRRDGGFSGTDALAMNVQPKVLEYLESARPSLVMAEGDRLGNVSFLTDVKRIGYEVHLYQLWAPGVAATRRAYRGSNQNETWLAGRITKVKNVRRAMDGVILAANLLPAEIAARISNPVVDALRVAQAKEAVG